MIEKYLEALAKLSNPSQQTIPTEIVLLLLLLGVLIFLWDLFMRLSTKITKSSGLDVKSELLSLRGSSLLPSEEYYSENLGLLSKPDAVIREDGKVIPVDIKPMSKKIRDRHVIELLAHLRLIEETEGKRPPYGILLMGPEARKVKVKNTPEKQNWLSSLLEEMRAIMEGVPAVPAPERYKCKNCDVADTCEHNIYQR